MYSPIKIKEKAGLVRTGGTDNDGKIEWIGTGAQWTTADRIENELDNHDCHLPGACQCEEFLTEHI